jgi:hypothetical protein
VVTLQAAQESVVTGMHEQQCMQGPGAAACFFVRMLLLSHRGAGIT